MDVTDEQSPDTLVDNSYSLPASDADVVDGFRLSFNNVDGLGFNALSKLGKPWESRICV